MECKIILSKYGRFSPDDDIRRTNGSGAAKTIGNLGWNRKRGMMSNETNAVHMFLDVFFGQRVTLIGVVNVWNYPYICIVSRNAPVVQRIE